MFMSIDSGPAAEATFYTRRSAIWNIDFKGRFSLSGLTSFGFTVLWPLANPKSSTRNLELVFSFQSSPPRFVCHRGFPAWLTSWRGSWSRGVLCNRLSVLAINLSWQTEAGHGEEEKKSCQSSTPTGMSTCAGCCALAHSSAKQRLGGIDAPACG